MSTRNVKLKKVFWRRLGVEVSVFLAGYMLLVCDLAAGAGGLIAGMAVADMMWVTILTKGKGQLPDAVKGGRLVHEEAKRRKRR